MNDLLEQLADDPWGRLVTHYLAAGGFRRSFLLLMVLARLIGLFVIAPYGVAKTVPMSVRVSLVLMLSLIIAPTLDGANQINLDIVPAAFDSSSTDDVPKTMTDLACLVVMEAGLGALLGTGVIVVLGGLRLGGEWLDRHSGLGLGSVLNPEWSPGDSACIVLVSLLGTAAFLTIEPICGQWILLRSLAGSFVAIPVGSASCSTTSVGVLTGLVQQSLVLGLRVAMPLVVTMILIDITLAFSSRSAPQTLNSSWYAARAGVGVAVLSVTLTSIPEAIALATMSSLQSLVDVR